MLLYTQIINFILVRYVFPEMKRVRSGKLKFPVTLSLHSKNNKTYSMQLICLTQKWPVAGFLNHSKNIHWRTINSSEFLGRQLTASQVQ